MHKKRQKNPWNCFLTIIAVIVFQRYYFNISDKLNNGAWILMVQFSNQLF